MKTVYFISGLGADNSVFQLLDLSYCNPVFIEWIQPFHHESLQSYALRLKQTYMPDDAIIIGLSFGGMLATEIVKAFPKIKVILISSAKTLHEIPGGYRIGKYLPLYKLTPNFLQKVIMRILRKRMGVESDKGIEIYESIIQRTDIPFYKWAIEALIHWNNTVVPGNIKHIHGTADKVLPYKLVKADYTIENGSHLMIMENAQQISLLLNSLINNSKVQVSDTTMMP
jgi:pimeloyl-ACP methyl ester carboxylesterase